MFALACIAGRNVCTNTSVHRYVYMCTYLVVCVDTDPLHGSHCKSQSGSFGLKRRVAGVAGSSDALSPRRKSLSVTLSYPRIHRQ